MSVKQLQWLLMACVLLLSPLVLAVPIPQSTDATISTYGPTKDTDHLYRIALKVKPPGNVTIDQIMLAILDTNINAFKEYNINGLKAGYVLKIPSLQQMQSIPALDASMTIAQQNRRWHS